MSKWAHYATPDEEFWKSFSTANPRTTFSIESLEQLTKGQSAANDYARKLVQDAGPPSGIIIEENRITVTSPPGEIECRIYTPESTTTSEAFPVYVYFHGGGFCLGSLDFDDLKCREICFKHRIVVVNVNYRHAPQFTWPTAPDDAYEATKWVAENATKIRVDLEAGFIVGGASAGANLTCQVTQRAQNDELLKNKITGQVLQVPSVLTHGQDFIENLKDKFPSFDQNSNDPSIPPALRRAFAEAYKPPSLSNKVASPLLAESFVGLPPAFVQIAGADPLRDEGLTYEEKLRDAKVPTKLEVYPGVPHGFVYYFPDIAISRRWRSDLDGGLRWLISLKSIPKEK